MTKTVTLSCANGCGSWEIEAPLCFVPREDIECVFCTIDKNFAKAMAYALSV